MPIRYGLARAAALLIMLWAVPAAMAQVEHDGVALEPGVALRVYEVGMDMGNLPDLVEGQTPNVHDVRATIDFGSGEFGGPTDRFVAHVDGFIKIDEPGEYTFRLISDDGSVMLLDGEELINHDGVHPDTPADKAIGLEAGLIPFQVRMFEQRGGEVLRLQWKTPESDAFVPVPAEALFTEALDERATQGGNKRITINGIATRPGTGAALEGAHPAWAVEPLRPDGFEPKCGAIAFLPNGMLAVTSFPPANNGVFREATNGALYILTNVLGDDPTQTEIHTIDENLHDPCGALWHDGSLYVCDRNELIRYTDEDGDGIPEKRSTFASGWVSDNYHHFTFGLVYQDGFFYLNLSTAIYFNNQIRDDNVQGQIIGLNGPNPAGRGCCVKIDADTAEIEYIAGGYRTPNGIGIGPEGILLASDNQGAWNPANSLYHVRYGQFFGHYNNSQATSDFYPDGGVPSLFSDHPLTPPAVYLPQNECSNSPTNPIMIDEGPYAGQMFLGELTGGGIRRVSLEQVNGVWQGAVFRFTQGFEAGVQRIIWGPDGCLYAAQMGSGGNWSWRGRQFGLERLRPTGEDVFELLDMKATDDGFVLSFTAPVPAEQLEEIESYVIRQWTYSPTPNYGGPKVGNQTLRVTSATPSSDRRSVRLSVPGVKPNHVVHLQTAVTSDDEEELWQGEVWYTFHQAPLPEDETTDLFNGTDLTGWHARPGGEWTVEDGVIVGRSSADEPRHGLLVSDETYSDFVVEFDYRVTQGDSGFYFRSEERDDNVGIAGFQVEVDNVEPGGLYETSGRAWVIKPTPEDAMRWQAPGQWNHVRLTCLGEHVKVEVNGTITAEHHDPQGRTEGHFALQLHGGQDMDVAYRDIRMVEIGD